MSDKTTTIQDLKDLAEKFQKDRNWEKHHTPKNLSVSIAIEAAELMEHFQWDEYKQENKAELESELADIITYCLQFARAKEIDISEAVKDKIKRISRKYPVSVFNSDKDNPKDYWRIKKNSKENGIYFN